MSYQFSFDPKIKHPPRLPDQVAQFLTAEIRKGTLKVGERLPSEAVLAKEFGVSRTVIREAFSKLKYDGLIASRQGSGITVVRAIPTEVFRLNHVKTSSASDLGYLYELRTIMEGTAAALAAVRRSEEELKELEECVKEMADAVKNTLDGTSPDVRLHQLISLAAHNPYLYDLMLVLTEKLHDIIKQARSHSSKTSHLPLLVQKEHEAIFDAIKGRKPEAARKAALKHLKNAARRIGANVPNL